MKFSSAALATILLGMPVFAACQASDPATPTPIKSILAARRFTLSTPYQYTWAKEPRMVSTGTLVVLEVDPAYVVPRNSLEPVLFAGNVAVERLNHGHKSGRVIGIIPGNVDLATTPIWFGTAQLPERLTPNIIEAERARAVRSGVRALPQARIAGVDRPAVAAKDIAALLRTTAAELVYQYSPQEKALADTWRLPEARLKAK